MVNSADGDYGSLRRAAIAAAVVAAGLAVGQAGPGITGLGPVRRLLFPRLAGQGDPGHVALTFDDGPDPDSTPQFAETLASRGVRATFFMLGSMVERAPQLAADLAAAGHEIAVHGFEHRYLPARMPLAARADLHRATEVIAEATGRRPRFFRPPYGVLSGPALLTARELGLTPVLWGAWGREWTPGSTPASVYATLSGWPGRRSHRAAPRFGLYVAARILAGRARGPAAAAGRVRRARAAGRAGLRAWPASSLT